MFDTGVNKIQEQTVETVTQSAMVHVCCSISESRITSPYFVDDDTINGQNSHSILKEFVVPELIRLGKASFAIFREDGAPPLFNRDICQYFSKVFPNQWIGRSGPVRWAPRSRNLYLLDFFLWKYAKNNIYKSRIRNLDELKVKIIENISSVRCFFLIS